jgi:hypothetical protein
MDVWNINLARVRVSYHACSPLPLSLVVSCARIGYGLATTADRLFLVSPESGGSDWFDTGFAFSDLLYSIGQAACP